MEGLIFGSLRYMGTKDKKQTPKKPTRIRRLIFGLRREARGHNWVSGNHKGSFFIYFSIFKTIFKLLSTFRPGGGIKIRLRC